jgi:hypothetical protein
MREKTKESIKEMIQEAVVEALTVDIQWEKVRDEDTGLPLAAPERRNEAIFLPAFIAQHLKFHEGAYRGMQETVDKSATNSQAMANILVGMEGSIKDIIEVAHEAKQQIEYTTKSRLAKLEMVLIDKASSESERDKANKEWVKITGDNYEGNS